MMMRPTSYVLETERSAVALGSFCDAVLFIGQSAVYAIVRLSV